MFKKEPVRVWIDPAALLVLIVAGCLLPLRLQLLDYRSYPDGKPRRLYPRLVKDRDRKQPAPLSR